MIIDGICTVVSYTDETTTNTTTRFTDHDHDQRIAARELERAETQARSRRIDDELDQILGMLINDIDQRVVDSNSNDALADDELDHLLAELCLNDHDQGLWEEITDFDLHSRSIDPLGKDLAIDGECTTVGIEPAYEAEYVTRRKPKTVEAVEAAPVKSTTKTVERTVKTRSKTKTEKTTKTKTKRTRRKTFKEREIGLDPIDRKVKLVITGPDDFKPIIQGITTYDQTVDHFATHFSDNEIEQWADCRFKIDVRLKRGALYGCPRERARRGSEAFLEMMLCEEG